MLNNSLSPIFHLSSEVIIPTTNQNHSFPLQLMSVELYDPYETNLYCYLLNIKWLAKFVIIAPLVEHSFVMNINLFKHTFRFSPICYIEFITIHLPWCICHIAFVTLHLLYCIYYISFVKLFLATGNLSQCICHDAFVTLHLSFFMFHVSCYICQFVFVTFKL